MPFPPGKYNLERLDGGRWLFDKSLTMSIKENSYRLVGFVESAELPTDFYELDDDIYILDIVRGEHNYSIMRVKNGQLLVYNVGCNGLLESQAGKENPPEEISQTTIGSTCYYQDNQKLFAALKGYIGVANPAYRLTPAFTDYKKSPSSSGSSSKEVIYVKVCNNNESDASVIFYHEHPSDQKKRVLNGWFAVPRGTCRQSGPFPKAPIALFATGQQGLEWSGTSTFLCVSHRLTYRTVQGNEQCIVGEARKGFSEVNVDVAVPAFTLR